MPPFVRADFALNTEILPLTFWWLLGNISKVIILWLLPYYLSTKVALQNNTQISLGLSVSGGQLFDWQLVNDAISILLGKWSSGHSQLVCQGGGGGWQFVTAEALSMIDGWASPASRSCPTVLSEERLSRREAESEDEVVWQTSQCGQLFMACTRWLVGHYLCRQLHWLWLREWCLVVWKRLRAWGEVWGKAKIKMDRTGRWVNATPRSSGLDEGWALFYH